MALAGVYLFCACQPKMAPNPIGSNPGSSAGQPVVPATLPPFTQSTSAEGTSSQGGGGDIPANKQVSADELSKIVNDLKFTIEPILFRMEAYGVSFDQALKVFKENNYPKPELAAKNLTSALNKMFGKSDAIYPVLKKINFEALTDGPCHDLQNEDKDGSAFSKSPNQICISISRLQKKVDHFSELSQIFALAIHELSHRVDATEDEAQAIQFMVLKQFGSATPETFNVVFDSGTDTVLHAWMFTGEDKTFKEKLPDSIPNLCVHIGENATQLKGLLSQKKNYADSIGVMFESPKAFRSLKAAAEQSLYLTGFCGDFSFEDQSIWVAQKGFDPKKPFPVSLFNDGEPNPLSTTPEDGKLLLVKANDWVAALALYQQIQKNINRYIDLSEGRQATLK